MAKKKEKELTEYLAGDKVKMPRPKSRNKPNKVGGVKSAEAFPAYFDGHKGQINYNTVYQVSGKEEVKVVDNNHTPIPYIAKEFVNHPVFNRLFKAVETSDNNQKEEE